MTCSEFVAGFSEYYDGTAPRGYAQRAEVHLRGCPSCRRYKQVVETGARLLRALPAPDLADDFRPRLQHRLYHVDQDALLRRHTASGSTAMAVLGIAVLLAAVAWSPVLRPGAPMVDLAPIIVSAPPAVLRVPLPSAFPFGSDESVRPAHDAGLWDDANLLLFEYSPLSQRYGGGSGLPRAGLDGDR